MREVCEFVLVEHRNRTDRIQEPGQIAAAYSCGVKVSCCYVS